MQCLDGILPSLYALDSPDQLDEEIRLFYVAVTRAKEYLYLTYPALFQSRFGDFFSQPSRFLEEIPKTMLEPWLLVEESENDPDAGSSAGQRQLEQYRAKVSRGLKLL